MGKFPTFFIWSQLLLPFAGADTVFVTNTDGGGSSFLDGSLGAALFSATDGTIIDCSPIAGQTIYLNLYQPPIGYSFTSLPASLTILGSGVILDGGGARQGLSLAQGSVTISNLTIQNTLSKGGVGGAGLTGGGGGTGGGGALYVHTGTTMTISAVSLNNNQAIGGAGGAGNATGGSGGGAGGYGGGAGGPSSFSPTATGSGGGGGGNNGGASGGIEAGTATQVSFGIGGAGAGGGGGGKRSAHSIAGSGGGVAASGAHSATNGGMGGMVTVSDGAGGGGGGGSATNLPTPPPNGGDGFTGSDAVDNTPPGTGQGGEAGYGGGVGHSYGAGGGGGGQTAGAAGYGASGGGGGFNGPGGDGGTHGGGGGASVSIALSTQTGGNGGLGAGGGGGYIGGSDIYGLGGSGGSATNLPAGGGGGSGLGGAIFIQEGGFLIIEDGSSFSGNSTTHGVGGIAVSGGSSGTNGSSLGEDIFIRSGGGLTLQINGTLTIPNPIEGAGAPTNQPGLTKSGTGTAKLNGANTYLGNTFIQAGTLNLNGSVIGDVYIESNGTLSGNATASGTLYNSGTISPGNSIGTVYTTNLYLYPTSIYNVEINSAGMSDEIIASGSAQIGGGIVVIPDSVNPTPITYTILSAGAGITGTFSSFSSTIPAIIGLIYNPFNIQVTYLPLNTILTGNALGAANCFVNLSATAGPDVITINDTLLALSFGDIQRAFGQMGPAQFSGLTQVQLLDAILVRSTYTKHLQEFCCKTDPSCKQPISLWVDTIGQWQDQKNSNNQFGYNDTTVGATIGTDYRLCDLILGCAFSYTHDHLNWKRSAGKASINSYYGGLYGRWNHDRLYMNTALLGAYNTYNTTRHLNFGTIDRHAHSKHTGNEWLANFGFGYQVCSSHFHWTPYINLDYVQQHEHSYTETGAQSLDLHVKTKNATLLQGEAGVELSATYNAWEGAFIPMLTLAYINQTPFSAKNYQANFISSTCPFTGRGWNYERNLFAPRFSLTYQSFCGMVDASIYSDAEIGDKYWAQDVGFDLTLRF